MRDLSDQRKNYDWGQLTEADIKSHPMDQFDRWFDEYRPVCLGEANAMMLSTLGQKGATARVVLLKMYGPSGLYSFRIMKVGKAKICSMTTGRVCCSFGRNFSVRSGYRVGSSAFLSRKVRHIFRAGQGPVNWARGHHIKAR